MASFSPPPAAIPSVAAASAFASIDPETLLEHSIAGVLILALVFVEDIGIFEPPPAHATEAEKKRSALMFRAALFALCVGAGALASSHPQLALMSAMVIAAAVAVRGSSRM